MEESSGRMLSRLECDQICEHHDWDSFTRDARNTKTSWLALLRAQPFVKGKPVCLNDWGSPRLRSTSCPTRFEACFQPVLSLSTRVHASKFGLRPRRWSR